MDNSGPAFPRSVHISAEDVAPAVAEIYGEQQDGMTYRQWLAGMALQGLCANEAVQSEFGPQNIARLALERADSLLAAQKEWSK